MPVATFPGTRGWGYDGLYTWAPHHAYGGPRALAQFVARAHEAGLGVILDVVYNHVGAGNEALTAFGPYFTDRWEPTAWGDALDYRNSGVREWAIQNAEMWVSEYGCDGLRLDAVGSIVDDSGEHVCAELARRVRARRRQTLVISERGDPDFTPLEQWHHDAIWVDALHHELHVALTGERRGYYARHDGSMSAIARELLRPERRQVVVAAQNHDQVGNRPAGDRVPPDRLRIAESVVVFSESIPLLFQGEEYAEPRPFQYFTDHIDPAIAEATRKGRRREFPDTVGADARVPDPQAFETFYASKLDRAGGNPAYRESMRRLLQLRQALPHDLRVEADDERRTLRLYRGDATLHVDFNALTAELSGA
jgi:maltooligosyltrehalose trehalohydrolase